MAVRLSSWGIGITAFLFGINAPLSWPENGSRAIAQVSTPSDPQHAEITTLLAACEENVQHPLYKRPEGAAEVEIPEQLQGFGGEGRISFLDYETAIAPCKALLEQYREVGDSPEERLRQRSGEAQALSLLATASYRLLSTTSLLAPEHFAPAVEQLQMALGIYQELGDQDQAARTLYRLGVLHRTVNQGVPGIDLLQQALAIYRTVGNPEWEIKTLQQLGVFYRTLGQNEEAIAAFQEAVQISQNTGEQSREAEAFYLLARDYYLPLNQYDEASEAFERHVAIIREDKGRHAEAEALQHLAWIYSNPPRTHDLPTVFAASFEFAQRAQLIYQDLDLSDRQAETLSQMAYALGRQSRHDEALATQLQALDVAAQVEDRDRQSALIAQIYKITKNVFWDQTEIALAIEQQVLQRFQVLGDRSREAESLLQIAALYEELGQVREVLEFRQQAYRIYEELGDIKAQAIVLRDLGRMYMSLVLASVGTGGCLAPDRYEQAITTYQQAIDRYQTLVSDTVSPTAQRAHQAELAELLEELAAGVFQSGCQRDEAIALYQQALDLYRQLGDRSSEGEILWVLGDQAFSAQRHEQAIEHYQQALAIFRDLHPSHAIVLLQTLSHQYLHIGDYDQALRFGQQQLELTRTVDADNLFNQANSLEKLGQVYHVMALGQHWSAIATDFPHIPVAAGQQEILRAVMGRQPLSDLLTAALAQRPLSDTSMTVYEQAIALYQEALDLYPARGSVIGQQSLLRAIGHAYEIIQEDELAQPFFDRIFDLNALIGDQAEDTQILMREAQILDLQAERHREQGEYAEAIAAYQRAYEIYNEIEWHPSLSSLLSSLLSKMGQIALEAGQDQAALNYFQQAVSQPTEQSTVSISPWTPHSIGLIYLDRGELSLALEFHEQYLTLSQAQGDRLKEFKSLHSLGLLYQRQGYDEQALGFYQRALALAYEIQQDPSFSGFQGVGIALESIGDGLAAQDQTDLAIVFYKSAVNQYEGIREGFEGSAVVENADFEVLFLAQHTAVYRKLADLLLKRDRILEAQQVLDLLKIQELEDYLRDVRGPEDQLTVLRPEQEILAQYNALQTQAVQVGQALSQFRQRLTNGDVLSPEEEDQFDQLLTLQEDLNNQFSTFVNRRDVQGWLTQLSPSVVQKMVSLEALAAQQNTLSDLNAVLLYPLILEDRLELILTLPNPETPPLRRTVPVSKAVLNQAILDLRQALRNPTTDAITPAQRLYSYLIEPLEADLAGVAALNGGEAPSIIYAPDSGLRYIPLAALHDGNQWLVQRFRSTMITSESLAELQSSPVTNPSVVAGAFADPTISYTVPVGDRPQDFSGLPFAGAEVKNVAAALPDSTHFLDQDFSWDRLRRYMGTSNILHFATHAAFVPGKPEDSFILFGNGDRAVLECLEGASQADGYSCINNWQLSQVDLVVLSACETGLADPSTLTDGEEVLGLGYQFQTRGAKAVIASLWKVSDGGTQALMDAFYGALQQSGISKSEALRLAQVALITGRFSGLGLDERGAVAIRQRIEETVPQQVSQRLSHPYYWAPFILIGNGL